jgi:hypothetical protein
LCLGAGSDFAAVRPDHCRCPGRALSLVPSPGATTVAAFVVFIATSPWRDTRQIGRRRADRIAGCFHARWYGGPIKPDYLTDRLGANLDGMLAEYANEEALVHVPSHLSFEEAATLPCAAVTAWVAVSRDRRVTAGDMVLTQGSGGVSVFALQFAWILGARVIATTSTAEKADRLRVLGASEVIDYTETPNWDEKVRELTNARGVDCVVEIGGPGTNRNVAEGFGRGRTSQPDRSEPLEVRGGPDSPV